jgi:predicted lipase
MKELLYNIKFLFKPLEKRRDYHLSKIRNIDTKSLVVDYKKPIDKQFEKVIEELQQYSLHSAKLFDLRLLSFIEFTIFKLQYVSFLSCVKVKYLRETKHWFQNIETYEPIMPNIISIEEYNENSIKMGVIDPIRVSKIKHLRDYLFTTLEVCDELYSRMMANEYNYQINSFLQKEMIKKDIKKKYGI